MDNQAEQTPTSEPAAPAPPPVDAPSVPPVPGAGGPNSPTGGGDHKALAIIGYIFPVLFFLPFVTEAKNDSLARFHANQQLLLLIWYVVANVIVIIPLLGWLASPLMMLFGIIVAILGIVNVVRGARKRLPLIGRFDLIGS